MIFHPHINRLSQYLDGALDVKKKSRVEIHLSKCEACRKKVRLLTRTSALIRIPQEKTAALASRVMEHIEARAWDTSAPFVAEIQALVGIVMVLKRDEKEGVQAFPGMALRKGDTLVTQGDSRALLRLNDGSMLYVNEETTLDLEPSQFSLALTIGEIFAMMKPQPKTFSIQTPSAVLGVIGTEFDAKVTAEKQTILQVLKGSVHFKNNSGDAIVGKKRQVEAASDTRPVPVRIRDARLILAWTGGIKPPKRNGACLPNRQGWIMKKMMFGLVAVIALGALVVGGFYLYNEYFSYTPSHTPPKSAAPAATGSSVAESKPAAAAAQAPAAQASQSKAIIPGDQTLVSRPPLRVGSRTIFEIVQRNNSVMKLAGLPRPIESRETVSQKMSVSVLEEQPGGIFVVELAFLSMAIDQKSSDGNISVSSDSDPPQDPKVKQIWSMVKAMSDNKISIHVTKDFDVVKVTGIDKLIEKLTADTSPQIVQAVQASFNEDQMKSMMKTFGQVLPDHPVKVGDTWSLSSGMQLPMLGKMDVAMKYRFARWEEKDGCQCMVIDMKGALSSKGGEQEMFGAKMSIKNGDFSGTIWYDPVSGDAIYSNMTQSMNLEMVQKIRDRKGFRDVKGSIAATSDIVTKRLSSE
jgi:hypothetical protein